jgi:creatinase/prolidase-like protein
MRRGLMAWDEAEIPAAVLRARVARLQAAMAKNDQDAILLYTNFIRSAAVSYVTAFSPYWADGVVLVPREGELVFATTLSKRVGSWIQSVAPIRDLVNSPTPGAVVGKRLAERGIRRLAVLELDAFPAGLYDDLASALPGIEIVDGSETFAAARNVADVAELRMLAHADGIAQDGLAHVHPDMHDVGTAIGAVEKYVRSRGAEEVYMAVAPDLDKDRRFLRLSGAASLNHRFAVRATVAYKGSWVRHTRTYARTPEDAEVIARANAWFSSFLKATRGDEFEDRMARELSNFPDAKLVHWLAESAVGTHPLIAIAGSDDVRKPSLPIPARILTLSLTVGDVPWCGAGLAA